MKNTIINKKKVLLFSPSFKDKGGVANYCRILSEEISPNFHIDCHVIANRPGNNSVFLKFLYPIYDTIRLIYKLFKYSYDIIHLNPSLLNYSLIRDSFSLLILEIFGYSSKTVVIFHGGDEGFIYQIKRSILLKKLFLHLYKKIGKILVLSMSFKKHLMDLGIGEETIALTTTLYKRPKTIYLENKKSENGVIKILFMSRFVKGKGIDVVCNVLKYLVDNGYKDVHFTFAGDGQEIDNLYSFINDNKLKEYVSLPGYVTGHLKDNILAENDIFIFPSKAEGLPNAILEAMGAGQAIISTPVGGIPEVVENGVNGFLHNSDDPVVFFNSVKRLIEDKQLLNEIQKRNRIKAESNYETAVVVKKIENLYTEVSNNDKLIC